MAWSKAQAEGFALAATAAADRGAALGARGLVAAVRAEASAVARSLADTDARSRRAWVSRELARLRTPELDVAALGSPRAPARALALLATSVPKALGREWLGGAPLPRAGYVPEPALRALLARLVTRTSPGTRS